MKFRFLLLYPIAALLFITLPSCGGGGGGGAATSSNTTQVTGGSSQTCNGLCVKLTSQ